MANKLIKYGVEDGVAILTIDDPPANTYTYEMMQDLDDAILQARFDENVHVIVLRGGGEKFFSAGANINMLQTSDPYFKYFFCLHANETLTRLEQTPKLVIGALNGHTVGGGLEIALACDIRVAAQEAFVTTAYGNIGLSGDYGASWLLTQLVGISKAKELFFTSARVDAATCLALGIVNAVVPRSALDDHVRALAGTIANGPPVAIRYMKENLNRAVDNDLKHCLAHEADRLVRSAKTADHREAVRAFLDKRPPTFEGR